VLDLGHQRFLSWRFEQPLVSKPNLSANQPLVMTLGASLLKRRASSSASANSQFRNVLIFGTLVVTFGQTIQ
jgi:hypothetical protein